MKTKRKCWEIQITATKIICVEADSEDEALQCAEENVDLGWGSSDVRTEDEYDPDDPKHAEWIAAYKRDGEFYSDQF